jgi:hypothetical protein
VREQVAHRDRLARKRVWHLELARVVQ